MPDPVVGAGAEISSFVLPHILPLSLSLTLLKISLVLFTDEFQHSHTSTHYNKLLLFSCFLCVLQVIVEKGTSAG